MLDPIQATADDLWFVGHHILDWLLDDRSVAIVTRGTLDAISLAPVAAETGIPVPRLLAGTLTAGDQRALIDAISDGLCSRIDLIPAVDPSSWQGHDCIVLREEDWPSCLDVTGVLDAIVVSGPVPSMADALTVPSPA